MSIASRFQKILDEEAAGRQKVLDSSLTTTKFNSVKQKCMGIVCESFIRDFGPILDELRLAKYTFDIVTDLENTYFKKIDTRYVYFKRSRKQGVDGFDIILAPFYIMVQDSTGKNLLKVVATYSIKGDLTKDFDLLIIGYTLQPLDDRLSPHTILRGSHTVKGVQEYDPLSDVDYDMFSFYLNKKILCDSCKHKDPAGMDAADSKYIRCASYQDNSCPSNDFVLYEVKSAT